jgi:hypothetical protein
MRTLSALGRRAQGPLFSHAARGRVYKMGMPEPPVFRVPPPRPSKRRAIDDKIAIAVLILIAVAMVAMLALSHPGENSGVGGRAPTVEEQR